MGVKEVGSSSDEVILRAMTEAVFATGQFLLRTKSHRVASPKDFLTNADVTAEYVLKRKLVRACPGIAFWGEESGGEILTTGLQWVVDPVDGTVNYYHGDHHWGVSVGLVRDGRSVAGVVYLPAKKQLFHASDISAVAVLQEVASSNVLEGCAWPRPIGVEASESPLVLVEWVKELNHGQDHQRVIKVVAQLDQAGFLYPQIRNASTASLMMVAQGIAGGFVHLRPEPCDIAAACLIVERAGGKVTDLGGEPWSVSSKGIIASNGLIHDQLLLAVNGY